MGVPYPKKKLLSVKPKKRKFSIFLETKSFKIPHRASEGEGKEVPRSQPASGFELTCTYVEHMWSNPNLMMAFGMSYFALLFMFFISYH